jgi:hypothetical protein
MSQVGRRCTGVRTILACSRSRTNSTLHCFTFIFEDNRLMHVFAHSDPDHILDCWRCGKFCSVLHLKVRCVSANDIPPVGWKGDQDSRYKCYPKAEVTSTQDTSRPSKTYTDL